VHSVASLITFLPHLVDEIRAQSEVSVVVELLDPLPVLFVREDIRITDEVI